MSARAFDRSLTLAALLALCSCNSLKSAEEANASKSGAEAKPVDDGKPLGAVKPHDENPAGGDQVAAEKHFDVRKDKSGVLARSAAALEASGAADSESLRELSHHAEKLPSFATVCKHEAELGGANVDVAACIKAMEHHMVRIGPELYAEFASCIMDAKTKAESAACQLAEREAEKLLHEKPHGEGLDDEACDGLFTRFEELAVAEAGEHESLVEEVLLEVKDDVITACKDHGTKAEVGCANEAKTMAELKTCASSML